MFFILIYFLVLNRKDGFVLLNIIKHHFNVDTNSYAPNAAFAPSEADMTSCL